MATRFYPLWTFVLTHEDVSSDRQWMHALRSTPVLHIIMILTQILHQRLVAYLETCVQKTCSGGPRGRSWVGPGVASRRSADAVGGILRAGVEPLLGRGGLPSQGTPAQGSDRGTWPAEPGNCSLRHQSPGWCNLKPSDGWDPRLKEGSLWRPETLL